MLHARVQAVVNIFAPGMHARDGYTRCNSKPVANIRRNFCDPRGQAVARSNDLCICSENVLPSNALRVPGCRKTLW